MSTDQFSGLPLSGPQRLFFFTFWFISGISWNHNLFVTGISLGTVLPSFAHVCSMCQHFSSFQVSVSSAPVAHSCLFAHLSVIVPPFGYCEWCLLWVCWRHILSVCLVQSFKGYTPWGGTYGSQQFYFYYFEKPPIPSSTAAAFLFFFHKKYFMFISAPPHPHTCMSVYYMHAMPVDARIGHEIPGYWFTNNSE